MKLDQVGIGFAGRLVSLIGEDWITTRLRELGFIPGASVELLGRLITGEPVLVRIGSARYALRKIEASCIEVKAHDPV